MHELGYTKDIVKRTIAAADASGAHSVKAVYLRIGEVRDIVDDLLKQCFHWLAKDTIAQDADIVVRRLPLQVKCRDCGQTYHFDPFGREGNSCPGCGHSNFEVMQGLEFSIEHIEVI
jgi:hydrogenase nickel incorporation protein HypA/HybF